MSCTGAETSTPTVVKYFSFCVSQVLCGGTPPDRMPLRRIDESCQLVPSSSAQQSVGTWNDSDDVSVKENVAGTTLPHSGKIRRDNDDVSVWELVEQIDLSNHTESVQPL